VGPSERPKQECAYVGATWPVRCGAVRCGADLVAEQAPENKRVRPLQRSPQTRSQRQILILAIYWPEREWPEVGMARSGNGPKWEWAEVGMALVGMALVGMALVGMALVGMALVGMDLQRHGPLRRKVCRDCADHPQPDRWRSQLAHGPRIFMHRRRAPTCL
jgi:hypothetical protein